MNFPFPLFSDHCKLVLFFTRGVSLQTWDQVGMFDREVAIYKELQKRGVDVTFVTYGNDKDLTYAERIPGIHICCNRWGMSMSKYIRLIPWLHWWRLHKASLFKSNQMNGAEIALRVARRFSVPFIARCGYMCSKNAILDHGAGSSVANRSQEVESQVFPGADAVVVTTSEMSSSVIDRFPDCKEKITIIPNYVDTRLFKPNVKSSTGKERLCFVGRLAPEKNLSALLDAIDGIDVDLDIIGEGPLLKQLQEQAGNRKNIRFHGRVAHRKLPAFFQQSTAFVFPSLYEGHPKTPIEAMACGLPVIATDVSGTREIIQHNETGWLCNTDAESLRNGIKAVLSDPALQVRLGSTARRFVVEKYSLDHIVELELNLYQSLFEKKHA